LLIGDNPSWKPISGPASLPESHKNAFGHQLLQQVLCAPLLDPQQFRAFLIVSGGPPAMALMAMNEYFAEMW